MVRCAALIVIISAVVFAAGPHYGAAFTLEQPVSISKLMAKPGDFVDKTVQVEGKITEVCQMMGCWMMLRDGAGSAVRIKVNDGDIVFPKDAAGRTARAEGQFVRIELSQEQALASAKHEAEETGRPFDASKVVGPMVIHQINGSGARLLGD